MGISDGIIISLHSKGLGNREISRQTGLNHRSVANALKRLGLTTNNPRGKPPVPVDDEHSICSYCGDVVCNDDFAILKSHADGRRLSKCRDCRKKQNYKNLNVLSAFISDKQSRLAIRAKSSGIPYDLPDGYLQGIYDRQKGLCFYTDIPLVCKVGEGKNRNSLSIDKLIPENGYVEGNVVLCCHRINTMKCDATLDEMKDWMPSWYARIIELLEPRRAPKI